MLMIFSVCIDYLLNESESIPIWTYYIHLQTLIVYWFSRSKSNSDLLSDQYSIHIVYVSMSTTDYDQNIE